MPVAHCSFHVNTGLRPKNLKTKLQTAKSRALQTDIADLGNQASAGAFLQMMKPYIGSTNPKNTKRACLSIVKNAHGEICRTPEESQNRWIEYFQAMEGGQRMNQVQYRSH